MAKARLILDTNQAEPIRKSEVPLDYDPVIVIAPLTWAEILNSTRHNALRRIKAIAQYKVLFGMDLTHVHGKLLSLSEKQIESFEPIFPDRSEEHLLRLFILQNPTELQFKRAGQLKQQSVSHAADIEQFFAATREQNHVKKSKGEVVERVKLDKFDEAMQLLFFGSEPIYRAPFVQMVTKNGTLPLKSKSPESFFDAVLKNPMLRRSLQVHAIISLGYARVWDDSKLNVGVSQNRNDVTDTHLALYARDGDTILSEDEMLRRAFRRVDPNSVVRFATWEEMIATVK